MEKKIKVLQFPIAASKGGITRYVLQNWKFIDKSKFQFDFVTMSKSIDFADELEREGCRIFYISCYAEENEEKFVDEFRKILIKGEYDIVHLHTKQWKSFLMEKTAKEAGVKRIIVHAHNTGIDTINEKKRREEIILHSKMLEQLTDDIATDFWACSKAAAEFLYGNKISQNRIKIMHNAIELEQYRFNEKIRCEVRDEFNVRDKFIIGHVGRFAYQKNHEFLIDVFAEVCKEIDNAVLLLIGDGELKENISHKVIDLDLSNKVMFVGKRNDIFRLLQAIDIFVLPSRFEGLPLSAIEAQTADLMCLCSDVITREVKVTEKVEFLSLNKKTWVEKILKFNNKYKREDKIKDMRLSGYDIKMQIKNIEIRYRGKDQ